MTGPRTPARGRGFSTPTRAAPGFTERPTSIPSTTHVYTHFCPTARESSLGPTHVPRGGGSRGGQEPKGIGRAGHAGAHGGGTVPGTHTRTVAEDRQDGSPQPLPALLSSFGIAASIRTTAELVVSILLQPTHPPSESDQRRDEATWLLHQSQQGRRGRRHHLFIYNHQSQQSPRERRHHIHSSKSSQPARPARLHDLKVNQEQH